MNRFKITSFKFFMAILINILLVIFAYSLGAHNNESKFSNAPHTDATQNLINFSLGNNDGSLAYFTGQITAPSEYIVSNDTMVTSYSSQGGMAPPRLILTKGTQVLSNITREVSTQDFGTEDCILVWSTNGYGESRAIEEDWMDGRSLNGRFNGNLEKNGFVSVGTRIATMYKKTENGVSKYIAVLPIGNTDRTSYLFETCNLNNVADFESVIKSIKFRPDLQF